MSNKETLHHYVNAFVELSDTEWEAFQSKFSPISLKNHELLLMSGEVEKNVYFLEKGIVRKYLEMGDKEYSIGFFFENTFLSDYNSIITSGPSKFSIEALTDVQLLKISITDLFQLYENYNSINTLGRKITELFFVEVLNLMTDSLTLSGEERYLKIKALHPEFIDEIPVKYLSSFLGLHPNSLSRIRGKLK